MSHFGFHRGRGDKVRVAYLLRLREIDVGISVLELGKVVGYIRKERVSVMIDDKPKGSK